MKNGWIAAAALVLVCLLGAGCAQTEPVRYGMVIALKPEKIAEYKELHANCWPGVLEKIEKCGIRNYSIYLAEIEEDKHYLFSYFEYVGDDFEGDMKKMAADGTTQKWWKETDPCQTPVPTCPEGDWWMKMEEVFHTD